MIFNGVQYYLPSSFSPERFKELDNVLANNGGMAASSLGEATHVVTNSHLFEGWQDVGENTLVVTEKWVERSIILGKLQPAQYYSADPSMIFSAVVACAADLPPPDLEVLSAGITALGGQWRTGLTRDITHLFTLSSNSLKYSTAMYYQAQTGIKVLLPHWFDDAVRLGVATLSTGEYEWPECRVLKGEGTSTGAEAGDERKGSGGSKERKALLQSLAANPTSSPPLPSNSAPMKDVWNGKRIMLSSTLQMDHGRRFAVEARIEHAGGRAVRPGEGEWEGLDEEACVERLDVLITMIRAGKAYVKAVKLGKTIGTLAWLFHVETTGVITRPLDQLLHYPTPKKPIEGFAKHVITVTNYTGEAREYLKKLISATGATFTPSMSGKNTVLVAAYLSGNKTAKAHSWSIPVVNHTWLEDCFVAWRSLTPALEKYIVFPPGVDFSSMLGSRGVGREGEIEFGEELDGEEEVEAEAEKGTGKEKENGRGRGKEVVGREGTNMSALDAREVEGLIETGATAGEGDVLMVDRVLEVDEEDEEPELSPSPVKRKSAGGSAREKAQAPVKAAKTKADQEMGELSDERGDEEPISKRKSLVRRVENGGSKEKERRKPAKKTADVDSDIEMVDEAVELPVKAKAKAGEKTRKRVVVDEDEDEEEEGKEVEDDKMSEEEEPRPRRATRSSPMKGSSSKKAKKAAVSESDVEDERGRKIEEGEKREKEIEKERVAVAKTTPVSRKYGKTAKDKALARRGERSDSDSEGSGEEEEIESPTRSKPKSKPKAKAGPKPKTPTSARPAKEKARENEDENEREAIEGEPEVEEEQERVEPLRTPGRRSLSGKKSPTVVIRTPARSPAKDSSKEDGDEDEENGSPGHVRAETSMVSVNTSMRSPSKRSAATKATKKLRDEIMPDLISFQQEMRRKSKSGGAREREKDMREREREAKGREKEKDDVKDIETGKKKKNSNVRDGEESEGEGRDKKRRKVEGGAKTKAKGVISRKGEDGEREVGEEQVKNTGPLKGGKKVEPASKGAKKRLSGGGEQVTSNIPSGGTKSGTDAKNIRLMTTQVTLTDEVIKGLTKLGVKVTTKPSECTHLLAPHLVRTEKFLCALAVAPYILTAKWATDSAAAKQILPEKDYLLVDKENEKKFKFKLSEAIARARENEGSLLAGKTFYVTPKVPTDVKLLKNVVSACGGTLSNQTPTARILASNENRHVISCQADASIWRPLASQNYVIYSSELLLAAALRQEIDWDDDSVKVPGSF